MSGFAPGDVVSYVGHADGTVSLPIGSVWRVSRVSPPDAVGELGFTRTCDPFEHPWCQSSFRKIDPATESFTAEIRACRPIKHREPANA